ncbi:MAG: 2-oxoglutarate ferredoxin oxidoreductase subunit beta [Myxococcota bacterium]|jgi:2-oxoglutarate ferredoxin oxidoreductase subunit beta
MTVPTYKKKDFMTDQLVRWCPGCGDYSVLAQVQTVFAKLGILRENFAVISGIGCSSRFPYYMQTFGFHTIHGRAPAFATGLKTARPDLSVWLVTGDGDGLSIGGNHLIHLLRRNVDLNVMLFNNRIYGLTKGQYSPTSEVGKRTKSSPMGSLDHPFEPLKLALGADATYVARSIDVFTSHLRETLEAADAHSGTSFLEIYQNCNIFNDGAFANFTDKTVRKERVLELVAGEPLIWGDETRRGLVLDGLALSIADVDAVGEDAILRHDPSNRTLATMLLEMRPDQGFPVAIGVFHITDRPTYDGAFRAQVADARAKLGPGDLVALLAGGDTWTVGR